MDYRKMAFRTIALATIAALLMVAIPVPLVGADDDGLPPAPVDDRRDPR